MVTALTAHLVQPQWRLDVVSATEMPTLLPRKPRSLPTPGASPLARDRPGEKRGGRTPSTL